MAAPVLARGGREQLAATTRFAVVGLVATGVYFGITAGLGSRVVGMEPVTASTLGFLVSVLVSYLGHHRFTFRVSGRHGFYLPRFLFVTLSLFFLSTLAMAVSRHVWHLDHTLVSAGIALSYPVASYLLNWLWTFRH